MGPQTHIHDLPDECLLLVFASLEADERLCVPAVCRRWRPLAASPSLFRDLSISWLPSYSLSDTTRRLQSLVSWVHTHLVGRVELLHFSLESLEEVYGYPEDSPTPWQAEVQAMREAIHACLSTLLAALCAPGSVLRSLHLSLTQLSPVLGPWVLDVAASLTSLIISSTNTITVDVQLHRMTALQELWLDAGHYTVQYQEGCRLPASLDKLFVGSELMHGPMPRQVAEVTPDLRVLGVCGIYHPDSYAPLTRLERLCLDSLMCILPCVGMLSTLRALQITMPDGVLKMHAWAQEDSLPALAALSRLTRLTSLDIGAGVGIPITAVAGLETLTQLRRFTWRSSYWSAEEWWNPDLPLPTSPGSLPTALAARVVELALPAPMLVDSLPQLLAAQQLQLLAVCGFASPGRAGVAEQQWDALGQVAAALPGPLTICLPPDALSDARRASLLASNSSLVVYDSHEIFPTRHFAPAVLMD